MLASLNSVNKTKERLIEIAADGIIASDEINDFIHIQNELERISITVGGDADDVLSVAGCRALSPKLLS